MAKKLATLFLCMTLAFISLYAFLPKTESSAESATAEQQKQSTLDSYDGGFTAYTSSTAKRSPTH